MVCMVKPLEYLFVNVVYLFVHLFTYVCQCVQKEEEKKSAGPKPTRNHQQRLENIVKQTTVETRVRHTQPNVFSEGQLHTAMSLAVVYSVTNGLKP